MNRKKTTNTTTKKAAKKSNKGTKTVPKPKRITLEELVEIQAKTEASIDRLSAENKKITLAIENLIAENAKTSANVNRLNSDYRLATKIDLLLETVGRREEHLGPFLELNIVHSMLYRINEVGKYSFEEVLLSKLISIPDPEIDPRFDGLRKVIAFVNMLLRNDSEAMAIEIKPNLLRTDVDDHLRQLQKLHDHKEESDLKSKIIYGAVAGAVVNSFAKALALENGLYVVEVDASDEENVKLDVTKPETCKTW
jgi:hypothetical protein